MNRETMNKSDKNLLALLPDGTPIYRIWGAEGEEEDATDTTEEDETEDGEDTPDDGAEYAPPTKEEWDKVQLALKKANDEAKKRRLREKSKKDVPADNPSADDVEAKVAAKYKPMVVRAEAKSALVAAGASSDRVAKLLRLIDVDDIEIGDDGELEGLEDQIDEIKEDWPELFEAKTERVPAGRRVPRVNGSGKAPAAKAKSSSDLIAGALLGRR